MQKWIFWALRRLYGKDENEFEFINKEAREILMSRKSEEFKEMASRALVCKIISNPDDLNKILSEMESEVC